jgi:hypothetical protein
MNKNVTEQFYLNMNKLLKQIQISRINNECKSLHKNVTVNSTGSKLIK